jgi:nuclear transport factor 2 (NTF2) superfamily protein
MAEDAWNTRNPERVSMAYTEDSRWRNRAEFPVGRTEIVAFLTRKWACEFEYRLIKEFWTFAYDRIAVRFAYEWRDDAANWFRSHGNENWEFDEHGLMRLRFVSINDQPIRESDRKFSLAARPAARASSGSIRPRTLTRGFGTQEDVMPHRFAEIAFTPTVKKVQDQLGSRMSYARMEGAPGDQESPPERGGGRLHHGP